MLVDVYFPGDTKPIEVLNRVKEYVLEQDGYPDYISFTDQRCFLGRQEGFKSKYNGILEKARKALNCESWKESWIGTGNIAKCAQEAMKKSGELVFERQKYDFVNRLSPEHEKYCPEAERVLFDIYCGEKCPESITFYNAVKAFGAKYDTLAFLFFIKDDRRFLPVRSKIMEGIFSSLGINFKMAGRCSWDNYFEYILLMDEMRNIMEDILPLKEQLRLIDVHSFLWLISYDGFQQWVPNEDAVAKIEADTEKIVSGSGRYRSRISNVYSHSSVVARETKKRAKGFCQLCENPAPFTDKKGIPYLESHHIIWLSKGGSDSTDNTAALCPNCHRKMHHLNLIEDVQKLQRAIH